MDNYFICMSMERKDYSNYNTGMAMPKLNKDTCCQIPVDCPVFEEQKKIGDYFRNLESLITLHQKKCFEWKKSGFSSASISWEQRKLGDALDDIYNGQTPSRNKSEYWNGNIKWLSSGELNRGIVYDSIEAITEDGQKSANLRIVPNGTFIMAITGLEAAGTRGNCALLGFDTTLNQSCMALFPKKYLLTSDFLFQWYRKVGEEYGLNYTQGTKQQSYNAELIKILPISLPVVAEQKKIASYLSCLDHLITLHQRKLELQKRLRNSLINRCFTGEKITMSKLILYHGSPNRVIVPKFGFGEDRHDYGRGFYLTENLELAKEWAVCRPDETNGWVHKYELEMDGLNILDFQKYDVLSWLAELMKHRDAADSRRYKMLAQKFIEKYGIDTCGYDVITGWRANASYFYIAKEFVRDNIDIEILEELLSLGGLGIQFCIKSERAFAQLSEVEQDIMSVDYSEFNDRYNERDINARNKMRALVDSDANKVTHVFSTLFER